MPTIELTRQEAETLTDILESYVSDLGMEIADTERKDMRDEMKKRKAFAIRLLEQLAPETAARGEFPLGGTLQ